MALLDPEQLSRLQTWRAKAHDGTITLDEMKEAVVVLRMGRKAAVEASAAKPRTSKAKPTATAVADMLGELENM